MVSTLEYSAIKVKAPGSCPRSPHPEILKHPRTYTAGSTFWSVSTLGDLKWWPRVWNSTELRVLLIATSPLTSEPEFCRTKAEQRVRVDATDGKGEVQSRSQSSADLTEQASAPGSGESANPAPAAVVRFARSRGAMLALRSGLRKVLAPWALAPQVRAAASREVGGAVWGADTLGEAWC